MKASRGPSPAQPVTLDRAFKAALRARPGPEDRHYAIEPSVVRAASPIWPSPPAPYATSGFRPNACYQVRSSRSPAACPLKTSPL
jgi:hypothetical protein